jgi:amidophosphoribosyltransferase
METPHKNMNIDDISTNPFDDDKLKEECGVVGIFGSSDASAHCALSLHALQHRGQEAAGIVSYDKQHFYVHRALGHVGDNFSSQEVINSLQGDNAIGHVRYSTSGDKFLRNVQPLFAELSVGGMAIAHNGNLTNAAHIKRKLINRGCIFQSTMDSEIFIHLISTSKQDKFEDRFIETLKQVEGAYSLVVMLKDKVIGTRDPSGVRPLVLGKVDSSYIFASETCALDIIGAEYIREVEAGEIVTIDKDGIHSIKPFEKRKNSFCIFEYIYFARPDSFMEGKHVYEVRKNIGKELAKENFVPADVIIPVPDSGVPSAIGYAEAANIPFELGIIRNHYVGRTFIEPTDHVRNLGVKLKHNANRQVIAGKRVVLIDDSIVRGTTSKKIVAMVRDAGAKEVHMRIASPPTIDSCYYGVDTPDRNKLMAANYNVEEMAKIIGADSLAFISIDGLYRAVSEKGRNNESPQYCDACFTSEYPIALTDKDEGIITVFNTLVENQRQAK